MLIRKVVGKNGSLFWQELRKNWQSFYEKKRNSDTQPTKMRFSLVKGKNRSSNFILSFLY